MDIRRKIGSRRALFSVIVENCADDGSEQAGESFVVCDAAELGVSIVRFAFLSLHLRLDADTVIPYRSDIRLSKSNLESSYEPTKPLLVSLCLDLVLVTFPLT